MMEIVDAHTHIDYLNRSKDYIFLCTMQDLLSTLSSHQIIRGICSQMPYSTEYIDSAKGQTGEYRKIPFLLSNILLLEEKNKYDSSNMIIPFFNLHPENKLNEQLEHIKKFVEKKEGFKGIKYHCQATDTHISSIGNEKILNFCKEYNLPILLHTGVSKNWNAFNILPLIRKNPNIRFSVAHLGRFHRELWNDIEQNGIPSNLFIDLSPYFLVFQTQKIRQCKPGIDLQDSLLENTFVEICSKYQNNILWGTDYPFIADEDVHPQGNYRENIDLLLLLPSEISQKIRSENTKRFLGG